MPIRYMLMQASPTLFEQFLQVLAAFLAALGTASPAVLVVVVVAGLLYFAYLVGRGVWVAGQALLTWLQRLTDTIENYNKRLAELGLAHSGLADAIQSDIADLAADQRDSFGKVIKALDDTHASVKRMSDKQDTGHKQTKEIAELLKSMTANVDAILKTQKEGQASMTDLRESLETFQKALLARVEQLDCQSDYEGLRKAIQDFKETMIEQVAAVTNAINQQPTYITQVVPPRQTGALTPPNGGTPPDAKKE